MTRRLPASALALPAALAALLLLSGCDRGADATAAGQGQEAVPAESMEAAADKALEAAETAAAAAGEDPAAPASADRAGDGTDGGTDASAGVGDASTTGQ